MTVALLGAYGFFLRMWDLGTQSLWIDEVFTLNGARAVLAHGYPLLESGHVYVNNFVTVYLAAGIIKVFGFTAFHPDLVRIPAVLFGTACIVGIYVLGKKLFNDRRIAVLASVLVAFSTHAIAWSRQVRGYEAAAFAIILALWFTWSYVQGGKRSHCIGACIALAFGCLSHWVVLSLIPVCILAWWLKKRPVLFIISSIVVPIVPIIFCAPLTFLIPRYVGFPFLAPAAVLIAWAALKGADTVLHRWSGALRTTAAYAVVLLAFSPLLTAVPKSLYELDLVSPQSDYASLYQLIQKERKPGDFIISTEPVVTNLYLGEYGAWIPYSLYRHDEPDVYTGVRALNTLEELKSYTAGKHGFIIWPETTVHLDRNRLTYIVDNSRSKILIQGLTARRSEPIWVFEF